MTSRGRPLNFSRGKAVNIGGDDSPRPDNPTHEWKWVRDLVQRQSQVPDRQEAVERIEAATRDQATIHHVKAEGHSVKLWFVSTGLILLALVLAAAGLLVQIWPLLSVSQNETDQPSVSSISEESESPATPATESQNSLASSLGSWLRTWRAAAP